jgi:hypothetical protein
VAGPSIGGCWQACQHRAAQFKGPPKLEPLITLKHKSPQRSLSPEDQMTQVARRSNRTKLIANALIAYMILLTIPVTVASAERSFSKLKLLNTYMRSTMKQERLNGLATNALEIECLEKIKYEYIIEIFISKNTRRMIRFNRS